MSSPLCIQTLKFCTEKRKQKPFWLHRLEMKVMEQQLRIQSLEDQLEKANVENNKMRQFTLLHPEFLLFNIN